MTTVLCLIEHDRGELAPASREALTAARSLGDRVEALTIGSDAAGLVGELAEYGVAVVHQAHHQILDDYGPEAWGETLAQAVTSIEPAIVIATGTDRGNEVMAQAAARLDIPFAANCVGFDQIDSGVLTRVRWGGSLLEESTLTGPIRLTTVAHHAVEPEPAEVAGAADPRALSVDLDSSLSRSRVVDRVERTAGVTLATAPVVVGGGRGVGSADGFGPLQDLAAELGGVVGCSRAVTNNGWRNHTDQVGQTGTRIAPEVYLACGISGAIQHWVGAMASKTIIAVNTDEQANMVTKARYAVIADLHELVPAVTAEIRRRRQSATTSSPPPR